MGGIWDLVFPCAFTSVTSAVCLVRLLCRGGWFAQWMQNSWCPRIASNPRGASGFCTWMQESAGAVGNVGSSLLAVR